MIAFNEILKEEVNVNDKHNDSKTKCDHYETEES